MKTIVALLACLMIALPAQAEDDPPTTNSCLGPHHEQDLTPQRRVGVRVGAGGVGQDGNPFTCNFIVITSPSFPGFACVQPGGPYQVFAIGPVSWQTYCGDGGASGSSNENPPCHGFWYGHWRHEVQDDVWVGVGTNLQTDCIHVDARARTVMCHVDSNVPRETGCWTVRDS